MALRNRKPEFNTKVILISGKAQHGKDTAAIQISKTLKEHGKTVQIFHYSDLLKYICAKYFGWDGKKNEDGRTLLQEIGTDVVRKKDPYFWVDFAISFMRIFDGTWDYIIIPDTRFPNEIEEVKEAGFDVVHLKIERPGFKSKLSKEQNNHPSETALDDVVPDLIITNKSTLKVFNTKIEAFTNSYILSKEIENGFIRW